MSVFTPVSREQLVVWLQQFDLAPLVDFQGISAGIENTNYFVDLADGQQCVLTLFERLPKLAAEGYLRFMSHLAVKGIPCPLPQLTRDGVCCSTLNQRPAALVSRLQGHSLETPSIEACEKMGAMLARMHLAGGDFSAMPQHSRGQDWRQATAVVVRPFLDTELQLFLDRELMFQANRHYVDLPRGIIHADLFRDNVLFDDHAVSGLIDFYFAGVDTWLFDVAVVVNDWCLNADTHDLEPARVSALLGAYHAVRPFVRAEQRMWAVILRAAALRFWLSRSYDKHLPREGELVRVHDPEHFRYLLQRHVDRLVPLWID